MSMIFRSNIHPSALASYIIILCGMQMICFAQIANTDILQVKFYYDDVEFDKAVNSGRAVLESSQDLTANELAFLHRYIALSYYNIGKLDSSRTHFLSLISIKPDTELDPVNTSPKIIDFFNTIQKDYAEITASPQISVYTQYVFLEDRRPAAGLRSVALPGWGQYYKGQKTKGIVLGSAFLGSFFVTGFSWIKESQTRDTYLASTTPEEIENGYNSYNKWYKTRRSFMVVTAVIWAIAIGDAFITPYAQPTVDVTTNGEMSLGIHLRF